MGRLRLGELARLLMFGTLLGLTIACTPRYHAAPPLDPAELWTPLPVQHVVVDGVDIAWSDSGGEGPPIVLVHGLSSYMGFWERNVAPLTETHRVLLLDLPGYGMSGRPDAPYTPPWYADTIVAWMQTIGLDKATFMGHSMGGQISLTLALEHPERVERLVLAAPAGIERYAEGHGEWLKDFWTEDRALGSDEQAIRANFLVYNFTSRDDSVERLIEERVRMRTTPAFRGTSVAVARSIAGMIDHPVYDRLGQVAVPTLVVYGTRDRLIPNRIFNGGTPASVGRQAKKAIPRSELVMIPGAGHMVHYDAADRFNAAVRDFLETP